MTTDPPPPRRKWHLKRWFIVLSIAIFAWSGWRVVDKRSAIKEAEALGWFLEYTDPSDAIRADWKNAFSKATWTDGVLHMDSITSKTIEQHRTVLHRLEPLSVRVEECSTLRDLSAFASLKRLKFLLLFPCAELADVDALKNLTALQDLRLINCTALTNLDGLKNLPALEVVVLNGCTRLKDIDALKDLSTLHEVHLTDCTDLKNVDGLKNLSALKRVDLRGCTGLTRESVDALKAALPNAIIFEP